MKEHPLTSAAELASVVLGAVKLRAQSSSVSRL